MKRFLFVILFFLASQAAVMAQSGSVRGFVYDKKSGEPLIFTNVYFKGTIMGATTDVNGFFNISKVPVGDYILTSTSIGFDTVEAPITIVKGKIKSKNLFLSEISIELGMVEISADRQEAKTEIQVSVTKITPKELKQIPTVGGEPDLAQYLQILPGVVFTGDQGGQLYIRGGSPIQNVVLLDGMIVYNPFHSIGLYSVFDTDIIRNVDVYTGGFNAKYGGRISAVIDITTRDGNKNRFGGKIATNPFTSKLLLEGPIGKNKPGGGGNSFLLSAKSSYLEKTSNLFYTYVDSAGLPYNFLDFYGKTSFRSPNGSKLNVFGFNFNDNVNFANSAKLDWTSYGMGSNFVIIPSASAVLIEGGFAYSTFTNILQESDDKPRTSAINGFNSGLSFTYFLGDDQVIYGIEILGFETDFQMWNAAGQYFQQNDFTTEIANYITYKKIFNKFLIEPSLRLHYYASQSNFAFEPRVGGKYNLKDNVRLKFAGGLYSQNLMSAYSDRDIVNIFQGFLSGPADLPKEFNGEPVTHNLQKANHLIVGVEYDIGRRITVNLESYIKYFPQLTNINRNKLFADNSTNDKIDDQYKKDFIIENGTAKGIDMLFKYDYKRSYVWLAYSIASVERYDGFLTYNPHFDRRHNLNFVFSQTFGKDLNWDFGLRWNFGTGFPFTKTKGFYPKVLFADGLGTDYTTISEEMEIIYGDLNTGRLP
ncbi:TonB-dependent receptor, partial [bacterium AH-315-C07]|nr:TonB-dependent receptor [bacterium AH-315-C07]